MTLDPSTVRVWRSGWWREDHGAWTQVESAGQSQAQWSAPTRDLAPALRDLGAQALTLSSGEPIAFTMPGGTVYLATREWGRAFVRGLVGASGQDALVSLPRPPLGVVLRPHPPGAGGLTESIERVRDAIARGRNNPYVIAWARQVIHEAGLDGPRGSPSPTQIVAALFAAQKKELSFVKDPVNGELMVSAENLLCLDPAGVCVPAGDCDDQLIVAGSAAASAGIPVHLVIRKYANQSQAHITLEYDSAPRLGGPWKCLDPSTDSGVCSSVPYLEQQIVDTVHASDQSFVGLGQPSTLGQAPPATTLPADQAAGWIAQLEHAGAFVTRSAERLRTNSAALKAVRADLGLPPLDPSPSGEVAVSSPPLGLYMQTGAYTADTQTAEARLLQTADFVSGCIADGLSGARSLYFQNGDIWIEAKPGDPYALLPGPTGAPAYYDAQGNQVGMLGIAPIIIGGLIAAAVTLAVAYVVGKVCEQLATTHHDDALTKIADQQSKLVATGAQTPEQAQGVIRALTDLDKATPPEPTALQKFLQAFPIIAIAGAAAAGVVGGFGLSRLVGSLGWFSGPAAPRRAT